MSLLEPLCITANMCLPASIKNLHIYSLDCQSVSQMSVILISLRSQHDPRAYPPLETGTPTYAGGRLGTREELGSVTDVERLETAQGEGEWISG